MNERFGIALLIGAVVSACAGSATPGNQTDDQVQVEMVNDEEAPEDVGVVEMVADIPEDDASPDDPDPSVEDDKGAPDLAPPDPGPPPDPGLPPDPGPPPDPGMPDPGPPPDPGPQYSETVAACIYVVEHLCDKFIQRCDDMAFNWIPDSWLAACSDFLVQQHDLVAAACLQIDNVESTDPNVALIKTFGPLALRECVDNFQCTLKTVGAIGDFLIPIIQGQKVETSAILALVTDLCFKN